MIDIHLHILPGIDDGQETLLESLTLAEALVQEGIHGVVEAPHDTDEFEHSSAAEVQGRVFELQRELDRGNIPWLPETERVIFDLRVYGFVPILALVERYRAFQKDPEQLTALQRQGVLAQMTASSLIGMQGNTVRRCAETLLKKGLIHCIGSDGHGLRKRPPRVTDGL